MNGFHRTTERPGGRGLCRERFDRAAAHQEKDCRKLPRTSPSNPGKKSSSLFTHRGTDPMLRRQRRRRNEGAIGGRGGEFLASKEPNGVVDPKMSD